MIKIFYKYVCLLLFCNLFVFFHGYLLNFAPDFAYTFVASVVVSTVLGSVLVFQIQEAFFKKTLIILLSAVVMIVTLHLSAIATMYVPGSKEHNYVMYQICFPALQEHYSKKPPEQQYTFEMHTICEENVWAGRDPLDGFE